MRQFLRFQPLAILILSISTINAQKFVNEFLNIGVGARNQGMFGSVVANVGDATAAYWNVAGLTDIESNLQLNAMHSRWFGGIANYDYFSIAKKLNSSTKSVAALSIIRLGVDNIPNTLNLIGPDGSLDFSRVSSFSTSDLAALLSYARVMKNENLSVGGNIKIIRRTIGRFGGAWGVGADLGARYKTGNFLFGVSARDITTTVNAWTFNLMDDEKESFIRTNNEIPVNSTEVTLPRLIIGSAYKLTKGNFSYLGELDLNFSTDGTKASIVSGDKFNIDPSLGVEVGYASKVFVRAGVGNFQSVTNPTNTTQRSLEIQPNIGLGLKLGRLKIDYALANQGSVSGSLISHIFSLGLDFVPRKTE
jgi:hypothetical protein